MTNKFALLSALVYGIKFSAKSYPLTFMLSILLFILQGVFLGLTVFVTQMFFDSVGGMLSGIYDLNHVFVMVVFFTLTIAGKELLSGLPSLVSGIMLEKSASRMNQILHTKISRIEPAYFENTKMHDDNEKAMQGSWPVVYITNITMIVLAFYPAYFVVMGIYLRNLQPQFLIFLIAVFLPILLSQFIRTNIIAKFEDKSTPVRREYDYYQKVIVDREYYKETRLLGGYSFFAERIVKKLKILNELEAKTNLKTCLLELIISFISLASYVGMLYMIVSALLEGVITVGAFAATISSIGIMFKMMESIVNSHIGSIASNLGTAHNFIRFLALPERQRSDEKPDYTKGIIAKNISFKYPNTNKKVLTMFL
jgi:ATP-binding cassette subfamily B protein